MISALSHTSIATSFDLDETDGKRFLVLEYIAGGTLKSKLRELKSEDKELSINDVRVPSLFVNSDSSGYSPHDD